MHFFSTVALPIDQIIAGKSIAIDDLVANAKRHPGAFALELFAFVMMIVGAIVTCGWAYDLGRVVGSHIA